MMRVYFDTEFTGLHQHTTLISIGCVADDGRTFYAECTDYNPAQVGAWIQENVIAHLRFTEEVRREGGMNGVLFDGYVGDRQFIADHLALWLAQWDHVEVWGDVLAYDWVLFCELFGGGAECLPRNVCYIPFDLSTLLKVKGLDPNLRREAFAGPVEGERHNALHDALVIKACVAKLGI